mgnify:CR=1 FL=1
MTSGGTKCFIYDDPYPYGKSRASEDQVEPDHQDRMLLAIQPDKYRPFVDGRIIVRELSDGKWECKCRWFGRKKKKKPPCRHIEAAKLMAAERALLDAAGHTVVPVHASLGHAGRGCSGYGVDVGGGCAVDGGEPTRRRYQARLGWWFGIEQRPLTRIGV